MEHFFLDLSVVLVGSALLAALAVLLRQPIILAYVLCGILVGPWGMQWIQHPPFIEGISHLGITLLLFLAGLCLHPQKLMRLFQKTALVTAANSAVSFLIAFGIGLLWRFSLIDALCIGLALMFSSTILVVKLLPTTELHHQHMGATCIGVLILQDLLAVAVLAFIRCLGAPGGVIPSFAILSLKVALFIGLLVAFEHYALRRIMARVEQFHEALFVIGLAWCFGVASISHEMGLFHETGAFFSGVVLARHAIARFISEELKPLRDFFLVLFFFALGAQLNLGVIQALWIPAALLALCLIVGRPWVFRRLLQAAGERKAFAREAGIRLGQSSEFALLIALLGFQLGHVSEQAALLIQLVTILTFVASSWIVFRSYPTPIGASAKLLRD